MNETTFTRKSILFFFISVILLSAAFEAWLIMGGSEYLYVALMWSPALCGSLAHWIAMRENGEHFSFKKHRLRSGLKRCKMRYICMGWLLPMIYLLIPYVIYWILYPENFAYHQVSILIILKDCLPITFIGVFVSMLTAMGEEIGWRGFMVPALFEKIGFHKTLLISSGFWCCWHLPILIGAGYMEGTPIWFKIPAFILCIFPVGMMCAILTLESDSIWPAAWLHAAHNNYDQVVLGVITRGENKMYFVSETGILTIICCWILAIVMYIRYRRLVAAND